MKTTVLSRVLRARVACAFTFAFAAVLSFSSLAAELTIGTSNDPGAYEIEREDGKIAVVFTNALASTTFTPSHAYTIVEALLVGGGGSGGGDCGGGGGAGAFVHLEGLEVDLSAALTFTVGAGGTVTDGKTHGNNGGNTTITLGDTPYVALGGGGGGYWSGPDAYSGGCGGGSENNTTAASTQFSTYGYGVGYPGGKGNGGSNKNCGGGGGGAGEAGHDYSGSVAGSGGAGAPCSITGVEVIYAGGGGAGSISGNTAGAGGAGGGGAGSASTSKAKANAGTDGLGGGGGGGPGGQVTGWGGTGGTGCVILLIEVDATKVVFEGKPTVEKDGGDFKVRVRTASDSGTGGTLKAITVAADSSVTNDMTTSVAAGTEYVSALTGLASDTSYGAGVVGLSTGGSVTEAFLTNVLYNGTLAIAKGSDSHPVDLTQPATVIVSRADTYGNLVVNYTVGGTGTAGTHYQPLSGVVVIPNGASSATIEIYPVATIPNDCTVTITLTDGLYFVNDAAKTATVALGPKDPERGFAKRIEFTVSYTAASTLADFPALVRLSTASITGFSYGDFLLANGGDLRFVTEDGATALPHEIEKWDESGESLVWVKVPSFAVGQKIIAYYGNATPWAARPVADIWKTGYLGVWHFDEIAAGSTPDATGNGLAMTAANTTTQVVAADGQIGNALVNCTAKESTSGGFLSPVYTDKFTSNTFTISAWFNRRGHAVNGYERFFSAKDKHDNSYGFEMENNNGSTTACQARGSSSTAAAITTTYDQSVAGWHQITLVYNGTKLTAYVDGTAVATDKTVTKVVHKLGFAVGNNSARTERALWGDIDEVRFAKSCLSADWVKTEYDMQSGTNVFSNTGVIDDRKQIIVEGEPERIGTPDPAYGSYTNVTEGASTTFTCPAAATNDAETIVTWCAGYRLTLTNGTSTTSSALSTSIVYSEETAQSTLTWIWGDPQYKATVKTRVGGVETTADGVWSDKAGNVTVTAPAAPTGYEFVRWDCDDFAGIDKFSPSLTFTIEAPVTLTAVYADKTLANAIWTGQGGDTSFTTPGNWSNNQVPDGTTRAIIVPQTDALALTLPAGLALGELEFGGDAAVTLTVTGALAVAQNFTLGDGATLIYKTDKQTTVGGDFTVRSGAKVTHVSGGTYRIDLVAKGDITIESGAIVDTKNCGYAKGAGPGGLGTYIASGTHASFGYNNGSVSKIYGSIRAPIVCGSGGENTYGGGSVHLCAAGTLTVNGEVNANVWGVSGRGCGAPGSVWLEAGTLSGAGRVLACLDGNDGHHDRTGGGRISLVQTNATDWTAFTATVDAGPNVKTGSGSIYRESAADRPGEGELIVNGVSGNSYALELTTGVEDANEPFGKVTVKANGRLRIHSGVTLRVREAVSAGGASFVTEGDGALELMPSAGETLTVSGGTLGIKHLIVTNAGGTVSFAAGTVVTNYNDGTLRLSGTAAAPLALIGPAGAWKLNVGANVDAQVSYVNVSNCNSSAGTAIADVGGKDLGGTVNWTYPQAVQPGDPITWTGAAGNTAWGDAGNWHDKNGAARAPLETDVVILPAGCSVYPVLTFDFTGYALTNAANASLTLDGGNLTLTGDFICAGAFTCRGTETWSVAGTVDFTGATVTPGRSIGILNGAEAQQVKTAGKTFYDLHLLAPTYTLLGGFVAREVVCDQNAAVSFTFGAGDLFKADKFRMVIGTGSITLASTSGGTQWRLSAGVGSVFDGVAVSDSNANEGAPICTVSYTDNGNNDNWRSGASTWTGAADTDWTNPDNWNGGVPTAASDVFVLEGTQAPTVSAATSVRSLVIGGGGSSATLTVRAALTVCEGLAIGSGGTLVADAPITVTNDVQLSEGANMTHTAGGSYRIDLTTLGNFTLNPGATIDTQNRGYGSGKGPGGGNTYLVSAVHASLANNGSASKIYGNIRAPIECGSGGEQLGGGTGIASAGGGSVHLRAAGTLTVNGAINANAKTTSERGGGSGGSIWLEAGTLVGAGSVTACSETDSKFNGRSGGGRISLVQTVATDWTAFTATVNAGPNAKTGCGSVYRESAADVPGEGELIVNGYADSSGYPMVLSPTVEDWDRPFGKVTVNANGYLKIVKGATLLTRKGVTGGGTVTSDTDGGGIDLIASGSDTAEVGCDVTVYSFTCTNGAASVEFATTKTVTVCDNGVLWLDGRGRQTILKSSAPGTQWKIVAGTNLTGKVRSLDVRDSDASGGETITAKSSTGKKSNNDNWEFLNAGMAIIIR